MNNIEISVLVAVYNTEPFLRKCLDSLQKQNIKNIEFILVDDGSTDGSGLICDKYVESDHRFKVIHKKNGGLASARQTGLENAKGKYIIVCDSDDWVEPDMYSVLLNEAKRTNADIVIGNLYYEYSPNKTLRNKFKLLPGIQTDNIKLLKQIPGLNVIKLIKKELFNITNSSYENNIDLSEDVLITFKLLKHNPIITFIDKALYHYRRSNSISYTNNIQMKNLSQLVFTYHWIKNNYKESKFNPIIFQKAIDIAFASLRTQNLDPTFYNQFLKNELPYINFFRNKISLKSLLAFSQKLFPIKFIKFIVLKLYPYFYK